MTMKAYENVMKTFQNIMKAREKNKVLKYCIVLFLGCFMLTIGTARTLKALKVLAG